jgi:bifunctional UDP-N-acetylglucosamine pyrophosphorylase / glucosamine-1-phosphate N-acetyltransferase
MDHSVIILAAGKGTRMKSNTVKVLHPLASRPLLAYSLDLGWQLDPLELFVVVGFQAERVREVFADYRPAPRWIDQPEQKGTADAVRCTLPYLPKTVKTAIVLYGDVPLLKKTTLDALLSKHAQEGASMSVLTAQMDAPHGYGRIVRDRDGRISRIVEEADADGEQKRIREINTGICCIHLPFLLEAIETLTSHNAQGEYYLTDIVSYGASRGLPVSSVLAQEPFRTLGINTRNDLAEAEKILRLETCAAWMRNGVTLRDPQTTYIDAGVSLGPDTIVEPGCHLRGATRIGTGCLLGTGSIIVNSIVGDGTAVRPYSVLEECQVGEFSRVGPMAHLRPGTVLANDVCVGNFVETKNARIGKGSMAAHLTYLGDCEIGERVNLGCGTITCNDDGIRKNFTIIEDDVFVGSDSQLIAPVRLGKGSYIGSGSTITEDVPAGALALSRVPQKIKKSAEKAKRKRNTARNGSDPAS